jgi:integrase
MARLQLLTGMRPGEVISIRGIDLEMQEKVWLYRPGSDRGPHGAHKNAYRGQDRVIVIGPKGQEVLRPWLRLNLQEPLFQPREAMALFRAEQRRERKSKVPPSQRDRRKRRPRIVPGERYAVSGYANSIAKAARRARGKRAVGLYRDGELTPRQAHRQALQLLPHWHPAQLRHAKATQLRREAGLDAARVVLGHRSPQITEVYAELDVNKAAEVMERLG